MSSAKIYAIAIDIAILGIAMAISIALFVQYASAIEVTVDHREDRYYRPVDPATDLIFGNPEADVFIVEYGDLECPYCQEFHPHIKSFIQSDWGVSGKVAWVWRNGFHINQTSVKKAETLECIRLLAGDRARIQAWTFIEDSLNGGVYENEYPSERYQQIMERLGIDVASIESCRKNNDVARQLAIAAHDVEELNIIETPYIQFMSGSGDLLFDSVGALTTAQLEAFISSIIKHSRET